MDARTNERMDATAKRIAFQGVPGAYSQAAILQYVRKPDYANSVPCASFEECFKAMKGGSADYALLPVENNVGGYIHEIWELMLRYSGLVLDEIEFRVRHCLLALPSVQKSDIKRVISHPQALAQTEEYCRAHNITQISHYDTAGSAKTLSEEKLQDTAAVASSVAAQIYNLQILDEGIEDDPTNHTRFLLISLQPSPVTLQPGDYCRFYVSFVISGESHSYFETVQLIQQHSLRLIRLDSRPLRKYATFIFGADKEQIRTFLAGFETFAYIHFVDVTMTFGNAQLLSEKLAAVSRFYRPLGHVKIDAVSA